LAIPAASPLGTDDPVTSSSPDLLSPDGTAPASVCKVTWPTVIRTWATQSLRLTLPDFSLASRPETYDCSSSLPGRSGDGALANVTFDRALRDNVPSLFRQSLEHNEDAHHQPSGLSEVSMQSQTQVLITVNQARQHPDLRGQPHQISYNRSVSGWTTRPDALARRTRRPGRRLRPRADRRQEL
jgi:hypothetical protein